MGTTDLLLLMKNWNLQFDHQKGFLFKKYHRGCNEMVYNGESGHHQRFGQKII